MFSPFRFQRSPPPYADTVGLLEYEADDEADDDDDDAAEFVPTVSSSNRATTFSKVCAVILISFNVAVIAWTAFLDKGEFCNKCSNNKPDPDNIIFFSCPSNFSGPNHDGGWYRRHSRAIAANLSGYVQTFRDQSFDDWNMTYRYDYCV